MCMNHRDGWVGLVLATVLGASTAWAHDSWLITERDGADKGATVRFAFLTGEEFPKSESAAKPERVAEWKLVRRAKRENLTGLTVEGTELAARKAFDYPGFYVVEIALKPSFIELSAKDFERYLTEEKAEEALASLRSRATPDAPARELYTKFSKTWLTIGDPTADGTYQQVVGHTLEIIPQSDPRAWLSGTQVEVKVLLEGQPLPGARVSSGHEGLPADTYAQTVVTDDNGVARMTLSQGGLWFFRTHVIRPLTSPRAATDDPDAPKADWESFWASVTFRTAKR